MKKEKKSLFVAGCMGCEAQNDIGFGTIVGSAVFNVLFVVGLHLSCT